MKQYYQKVSLIGFFQVKKKWNLESHAITSHIKVLEKI